MLATSTPTRFLIFDQPAFMTITSISNEPPADLEVGKLWTLEDTFTHPDFRLLYVPPRNEHGRMTIITPSKHEPSYVPGRKFYALSHLWGTDPNDNLWEVSGFIDDENGTTVEPIPMREEKRETFLNLLQASPGYWWIDVLCCRTDTPPVIMRGVYGCCHTCFAMIDCPPEAVRFFRALDPDCVSNGQDEECKHARDILKSRWFSRVWTMQELALPSEVMLLSETCGRPCYVSVDLLGDRDVRLVVGLEAEVKKRAPDLHGQLSTLRSEVRLFYGWGSKNVSMSPGTLSVLNYFHGMFAAFAVSERSCYFVEDYVYGTLGILGWDIPRLNNLEDTWDRFLFNFRRYMELYFWKAIEYLSYSQTCRSEVNTCYRERPKMLFKHYQETVRINYCERAKSYAALSEASKMADVYRGLVKVTVDCTCYHCKRLDYIVVSRLESFNYCSD